MFKDNGMYQNVLVAIDLSKHSDVPMKKAMQVAAQCKASLDVIHVISMAIPYYSYSFSTEIQDAVYTDAKQHFVKFCEQYNILKANQHLLIGAPKVQILDLAEKLQIDLLVVGSHGDQHMLPATFGSTASGLVARAKCDVLTVSVHPVGAEGEAYEKASVQHERERDIA